MLREDGVESEGGEHASGRWLGEEWWAAARPGTEHGGSLLSMLSVDLQQVRGLELLSAVLEAGVEGAGGQGAMGGW